jgi:hypothetical protein
VLDRRGGEARQLTEVKGNLSAYEWSPDSQRNSCSASPKTLKPMPREKDDKDDKG